MTTALRPPPTSRQNAHLAYVLGRVAAGDALALEEIYRTTAPKLLGVIQRVLGPGPDAEDVLQDVYLTVWRRADSFDAARTAAPMAWLAAIARNRAIDRMRARQLRSGEDLDQVGDLADEQAIDAFEALAASEEGARLARCLETLDGNRARSIRMSYFGGLTYEAVAREIDQPLGTVKSWIRRGLAELRACLET